MADVLCGSCKRPVHSTLTDQCPHCGAENYGQPTDLERAGRYKRQRDELLEAIREHEELREQHPKGPSKRNQKLWEAAKQIEDSNK